MASASATPTTYAQPGTITRDGAGSSHLDKEVDAMIATLNNVPVQGEQFFRIVNNARTDVYKEANYGSALELAHKNEDTDELPYFTPAKCFDNEFTIVNYRSAIRASQSMMEDELFGKLSKMAGGLSLSARRLQEFAYADPFNNAFENQIGADGMYMCDEDHPNENRATGTWDNLQTAAALSHATYSTARLAMRKRTNERGRRSPIFPGKLIVSADNEEVAKKILRSEKVNDNALNNINVWKDDAMVVVWDYLTSTTAWFLQGKVPRSNWGTVYVNKYAPKVSPNPAKTANIVFDHFLRMRFAIGIMTCREIEGNAGA